MKKFLFSFLSLGMLFSSCSGDDNYCLYPSNNPDEEVPAPDPDPNKETYYLPGTITYSIDGVEIKDTYVYDLQDRIQEVKGTKYNFTIDYDGENVSKVLFEKEGVKDVFTFTTKSNGDVEVAGTGTMLSSTPVTLAITNNNLIQGVLTGYTLSSSAGNLDSAVKPFFDRADFSYTSDQGIFRNSTTPRWVLTFLYEAVRESDYVNFFGCLFSDNLVKEYTYTSSSTSDILVNTTFTWTNNKEEFPYLIEFTETLPTAVKNGSAVMTYEKRFRIVE